jgi:sodium-type flagellar protein MotY
MGVIMRMQLVMAGLVVLCGFSADSMASLLRYEADIEQSGWKNSRTSLHCALTHEIPGFGRAQFHSYNGKRNLSFQLQSEWSLPLQPGPVTMRVLPPAWSTGEPAAELGTVAYSEGRTLVSLKQVAAWRLLSELGQGRFPTFFTDNYGDDRNPVAIGLSAVRFQDSYGKFQDCLAALLPYTFADIAKSTLYFEFDRVEFTPQTQARLNQIREYLKADKELDLMVIEGHTDSLGGRWLNQQLGKKRADAVRDYLLQAGIDPKRVQTVSHGERKPVADNKNESGREKNRRVLVTISR